MYLKVQLHFMYAVILWQSFIICYSGSHEILKIMSTVTAMRMARMARLYKLQAGKTAKVGI